MPARAAHAQSHRRSPDLQRTRAQYARPLILCHVWRGDAVLHGDGLAFLTFEGPVDIHDIVVRRRTIALLPLLSTLLSLADHVHLAILVKLAAKNKTGVVSERARGTKAQRQNSLVVLVETAEATTILAVLAHC